MRQSKIIRLGAFILKVLTILAITCLLLSYLSPFISPKTIPFLPFFGLLYPVIIFVIVLLFIFFTVVRSKWALILLFFVLIGIPLHLRQFAFGKEEVKRIEDSDFKIMSYNVRLFDLYSWSVDQSNRNRLGIFDYLESEMPDIVCFQEFYHQDKSTEFPTRDSLVRILKTQDFHERYSLNMRGRKKFGIAMLSRYEMVAKGEVPLQIVDSIQSDNYCIFADIVKNKDTIRVYNVHLQSIKLRNDNYTLFDDNGNPIDEKSRVIENAILKLRTAYPIRAEQTELVLAHAQNSPYPVVICGDFNDTPLSYTYNQFYKKYMDAFRESSSGMGSTYVGKIPAGRIDYIFHSSDLKGFNFVLQKEVFSDHRAISCMIRRAKSK